MTGLSQEVVPVVGLQYNVLPEGSSISSHPGGNGDVCGWVGAAATKGCLRSPPNCTEGEIVGLCIAVTYSAIASVATTDAKPTSNWLKMLQGRPQLIGWRSKSGQLIHGVLKVDIVSFEPPTVVYAGISKTSRLAILQASPKTKTKTEVGDHFSFRLVEFKERWRDKVH